MKNQLMAEFAAMKQMLLEQQAELASLRQALAQKTATRSIPTVTAAPAPVQLKTPDTSRRKMLKRMGLAVLAGGAALGVATATYSPAEARISVNPSSNTNVGVVITRNGKTITNIPTTHNYGLIVSADDSLTASTVLPGSDVGVFGNSSTGTGVYGNSSSGLAVYATSNSGNGMHGNSSSGLGVIGTSDLNVGVFGQTASATFAAIRAHNNYTSGIALQIEQGGLSVTGAGISSTTSSTAAFIHQTTSGVGGNISANLSKIDNPLCNNRPDALLFITHNSTPPNANFNIDATPVGAYYASPNWYIYQENAGTISSGLYFNVLIINHA